MPKITSEHLFKAKLYSSLKVPKPNIVARTTQAQHEVTCMLASYELYSSLQTYSSGIDRRYAANVSALAILDQLKYARNVHTAKIKMPDQPPIDTTMLVHPNPETLKSLGDTSPSLNSNNLPYIHIHLANIWHQVMQLVMTNMKEGTDVMDYFMMQGYLSMYEKEKKLSTTKTLLSKQTFEQLEFHKEATVRRLASVVEHVSRHTPSRMEIIGVLTKFFHVAVGLQMDWRKLVHHYTAFCMTQCLSSLCVNKDVSHDSLALLLHYHANSKVDDDTKLGTPLEVFNAVKFPLMQETWINSKWLDLQKLIHINPNEAVCDSLSFIDIKKWHCDDYKLDKILTSDTSGKVRHDVRQH